ncbi:unnamed protein product [Musa acuminata var. zebrina]
MQQPVAKLQLDWLLLLLLVVELLQLLQPQVAELAVPVGLEPWPARRVVYRLGLRLGVRRIDPVVPHQEVPGHRQLPDVVVIQPHEAVEEGPGLGADQLRRERPVLGVGAVVEDHGGPVLAGVHRLRHAVHLHALLGGVVVVDAHDGVAVVGHGGQLRDVGGEEEVAVDEHGPALVPRQEGREEAGEGELGALGGAAPAGVEAGGPQLGLLEGDDLERDGGAPEEGVTAYLEGGVLTGVVPDEDSESGQPRRLAVRLGGSICLPDGHGDAIEEGGVKEG